MAGERAFSFLHVNEHYAKPRRRGVTEIRGPYYTVVGRRYLEDLLETMGAYVDTLKYAGGSSSLMPREVVRELNELCHRYQVEVSTGGFLARSRSLTGGSRRPGAREALRRGRRAPSNPRAQSR
jgi:phosphosulfolactate synthase (CoM biosynthesis protein A)